MDVGDWMRFRVYSLLIQVNGHLTIMLSLKLCMNFKKAEV